MKIAALACLGIAIALQVARDRAYPREMPEQKSVLYVRSPEVASRLALAFDSLAADVYWIRAIQHYGRQRLSRTPGERDYGILYPLLDLTTSLDPHFDIAYRFGAIFLSEPQPGGPGRPDLAIALLQKGIAAQRANWQFYHDIGFVHYWSLRDAAAAAEWMRRAAQQPGAPNWLEPVAAALLTQGADRDSARHLWRQLASSDEDWLRRRAELALGQIDALDQIDALEQTIAERGTPPYSWTRLVRDGVLPGIPVDPSRTPYVLDPSTGRVTVSRDSPLFPLPPAPSK